MKKQLLAFDLGASSGRAIAGGFDGERLTLSELHRFANEPVLLGDTLYWDFLRLFHEIKTGIAAARREGLDFQSLGVDTWGVDFGLVDAAGRLLDNPVHYRDVRNIPMPARVFETVSPRALYESTGIQIMDINSLFQLKYLAENRPELLDRAKNLLFMPDLFNFYLSGQRANEYTIASTSQMLDARAGTWDRALLAQLGIPGHMLGDVTLPGTRLGPLTTALREELGVGAAQVVAVTCHDTASAVAAVPAGSAGGNWAYLSSGTWSLLGLEEPRPRIDDGSFAANYTNEGGYGGTIRFLKNIIGLWLMQESRRQWIRESGPLTFREIDDWTAAAAPLKRFIDPDDPSFVRPGNMPQKIRDFIAATGQKAPESRGDISRCITESLALAYRRGIETLERLTGEKIDVLHIIGGGVKDKMLCECTANATGLPVVAGPVEATAIGNILTQLLADGSFASLAEARACVARSFELTVYEPRDRGLWEDAYGRFLNLTKR